MSEPLEVLFVCTANICRSPTMELVARDLAGDVEQSGVVFASSGTHARDGDRFNADMLPTLSPALVDDAGAFRSRHLTPQLLDSADLVLTAESVHRQHILDDHPQLHRKVFTLGQFEATIAEIPDLGGYQLIAAAGQRRPPSSPAHDVADPYRRGKAAATKATGTITAMLSVVVPRLVGDR